MGVWGLRPQPPEALAFVWSLLVLLSYGCMLAPVLFSFCARAARLHHRAATLRAVQGSDL